jgi:O-antigen/teichoic acid export membrane protein
VAEPGSVIPDHDQSVPVPVATSGDGADEPVADPGAARNVVQQFAGQIATLVFTAGLTLYLVRALGAAGYGVYALAVSIGALMLFPAGLGLPMAVGRFLADHRTSAHQLREIFWVGMRLQVPAATVAGVALFAASGAIADAYNEPALTWPLRWVALSVIGQALFAFLVTVGASVRRSSLALRMTVIESAFEASASIALVIAGGGAAGAAFGKLVGYAVAGVAGVILTMRLLGRSGRRNLEPRRVSLRTLTRYAGVMFVVDVTWSAITQVDVLLIGALLTSAAVGSFGAVLRLIAVLGYLGLAVSAAVAPRLSLAGGNPDVRSFERAIRYLIVVQGLTIAPMLIWATPIVDLLFGPGYHDADQILRVLTLYSFLGAPASLITVAVTYLGEGRRRVVVMLATLVLGLALTYVLIEAVGVVGAAIGDDIVQVVYVSAHLWISSTLVTLDLRRLAWSLLNTVLAASAAALVLLAFGTDHLSPAQWVGGTCIGVAVYLGALVFTRELTVSEILTVTARLRAGLLGGR